METKTFKPEIESVCSIQEFVKSALSLEPANENKCFAIDLIIEELIINITTYGIKDLKTGFIAVCTGIEDETLFIGITDNGPAFNPLEQKDPDIFLPLEDRQPGGLGIYLVKQFVKDIRYERRDHKNLIRLWLA
ncbi:ATP-binding protein [uncultured Desulfobacter sp.]|uniref:ATP-binding protein n=1 Tax=uncultured Desulfobacter sp. TaxID=240139 RepID=UPI0029F4E4FB|nr:ATP-binding protein [uncultured Desulfobacter sp.]